jgi:hypothetical protein
MMAFLHWLSAHVAAAYIGCLLGATALHFSHQRALPSIRMYLLGIILCAYVAAYIAATPGGSR